MPNRRLAIPAAIVLALAANFAGPVQAQINPFRSDKTGPQLERTDLALIGQAAEKLYTKENVADDAMESWNDPLTGASGSVTVVNSSHRRVKGDYLFCHRLRYEVAWKGRTGTRSYLIDWFRLPDGTWKVA